ncbi:MAG: 2Fe-2S iron-sulfur cluster-binding protein [Pseudomonadota bacterium]
MITLSPSGKQFGTHQHASILEAGLAAGIPLPYRCSNGSCGDCRARVLGGQTEAISHHDYVLSHAEKNANVVLLCCHRALGNVEIEVTEARSVEDIPRQQLNTRVCHTEFDNNTLIVRLKILRGKALWYLAGQYATLSIPGQPLRTMPIASCPCETGYLEFHLPPDAAELQQAITALPKRERIVVDGPHGNFTIDDAELESHHHVLIAGDQQFAVIKPMIEHIIATGLEPLCTLIRITSSPYKHNLCRSWDDAFDRFHYHSINDATALPDVLPGSTLPITAYVSATTNLQHVLDTLQQVPAISKVIADTDAGHC